MPRRGAAGGNVAFRSRGWRSMTNLRILCDGDAQRRWLTGLERAPGVTARIVRGRLSRLLSIVEVEVDGTAEAVGRLVRNLRGHGVRVSLHAE